MTFLLFKKGNLIGLDIKSNSKYTLRYIPQALHRHTHKVLEMPKSVYTEMHVCRFLTLCFVFSSLIRTFPNETGPTFPVNFTTKKYLIAVQKYR